MNWINKLKNRLFTKNNNTDEVTFMEDSVFVHKFQYTSIGYNRFLEFINDRMKLENKNIKSATDVVLLAIWDKNSGKFLTNAWAIEDDSVYYLNIPGTAAIRYCYKDRFLMTEVSRAIVLLNEMADSILFREYGFELVYNRKNGSVKVSALISMESFSGEITKIKRFVKAKTIAEALKIMCC